MSVLKRVIPCLDVDKGRVVKGTNFVGLRDAGDPGRAGRALRRRGRGRAGVPRHHRLARAARHDRAARPAHGGQRLHPVHDRRRHPLARGRAGGARRRRRQGVGQLGGGRAAGADGRAGGHVRRAVRGAGDRREAASDGGGFEVFVNGGRVATGRDAVEWAREGAERGAGEILLTSMDRDGTEGRLRPGADAGGGRGRRHPGDRLRRRRASSST